ncbi:MAG: hypothetical protein KDH48_17300, partial [Rhodoferax sp.]|nr:hypothetical protein [Rhodoferax sp.]
GGHGDSLITIAGAWVGLWADAGRRLRMRGGTVTLSVLQTYANLIRIRDMPGDPPGWPVR